jgi:hypothetical protein
MSRAGHAARTAGGLRREHPSARLLRNDYDFRIWSRGRKALAVLAGAFLQHPIRVLGCARTYGED